MKGRIIITTQPKDQANKLIRLLTERGAHAKNYPMIRTQSKVLPKGKTNELLQQKGCNLLIFTSRKGVKGFFENLLQDSGNFHIPEEIRIAVIGSGTGEALRCYGHEPHIMNPGTTATDLADHLIKEHLLPHSTILLVQGNLSLGILKDALTDRVTLHTVVVYETLPEKQKNPDLDQLILNQEVEMLVFTSPSTFYIFRERFPAISLPPIAVIGSTTAAAIRKAGFKVAAEASTPEPQALAEAIEQYFRHSEKQKE